MPTTQRTNTPHDQTDNSTFGELLVYLYYDTCIIIIGLLLVRMYLRMLFNTFVLYDRLLVIVYVPPYMLYSLFIITWYVPRIFIWDEERQ